MLLKRKNIVFKKVLTLLMAGYFLMLPVLSTINIDTCSSSCPMHNSLKMETANHSTSMNHTCQMNMNREKSTTSGNNFSSASCKKLSLNPFAVTFETLKKEVVSSWEILPIVSYLSTFNDNKISSRYNDVARSQLLITHRLKLSTVLLI